LRLSWDKNLAERNHKEKIMTQVKFNQLGLSDILLDALTKKGFENPTPIQAETIPLMLSGDQDVIGLAQTGTGKTAAFGLPIIDKIESNKGHVQAIVVAPTRELAIQVCNELNALKGQKRMSIIPIYGGAPIYTQKRQLKDGADIVVGTPGRLIDHIKSKNLNLKNVDYLVLDEADEMLTGGFVEEIEMILAKTNEDRKTLLFSATMPPMILKLTSKYMKNPITIKAKTETLATTLTEQSYFEVRESDKLHALCRVIDIEDSFYGLVFCKTKRDVDSVKDALVRNGYQAESMHGDLSQGQRESVLRKFRSKIVKILVVTDVASRGLDISGLSHVVNFAIPQDPESYVHRIGRTGRAGQSGTAITFVTPNEFRKMKYIQNVAKTKIEKRDIPSADKVIDLKKERIKRNIESTMKSSVDKDYFELADDILAEGESRVILASILKLAYEKDLSKKNHAEIKKVFASNDNYGGRSNNRNGGGRHRNGNYQGRPKNQGYGKSKNRRFAR
jgi:ATP-dependent RNA helicase DeaD